MFFLNHDLSNLIVDLPSIDDLPALLNALHGAFADFKTVNFIHYYGATHARRLVEEHAKADVLERSQFYVDDADPFASPHAPLIEYLQQNPDQHFNSVFITQDCQSLEAAHHFPIGSVLFCDHLTRNEACFGPDQIISGWSDLTSVLKGELLGYLGEANVSKGIFPRRAQNAKASMIKIENEVLQQCPIYVGGRYLLKKDDPCYKRHLYSQYLIHAKGRPERDAKHFSHVIDKLINYVAESEGVQNFRLTYVPPRPSDPVDRLQLLLSDLQRYNRKLEKCLIGLKDYPKQKSISGQARKAQNVYGAFGVAPGVQVQGQNIVVIDDIGTSFSTLNECARTLLRAGAARVALIAIAVTVRPSAVQLVDMQCGKCGYPLVLRINSKTGDPFWACGDNDAFFKRGEKGHTTRDLKPGFDNLRKLEAAMFTPDEEIEF